MQEFLARNGIKATAKRFHDGSMRNTWRLYDHATKWTIELADKLNSLGFTWIDGRPLEQSMGNGGVFSISVRGLDDLASPSKHIDA
jgi:hypothetical protein